LDELAHKTLYYLSLDQTHWLLTLGLILLFALFEHFFPRVKNTTKLSRILVLFVVAILANGLVWLFKTALYFDIVSLLLKLQIFSVSKLEIPTTFVFILCILMLDLLVYVVHFLSHKITFLWKLHAIHHADEHIDAKTSVLQHPLETLVGSLCVLSFSVILGIPVIAVILYVGIGTVHNVFSHANVALPTILERLLRLLIVTPDMHRTHHSIEYKEGNSNFGQVFSFWDRIFGTYVAHPATGEEKLIVGLVASEKPTSFTVSGLLLHPFRNLYKKK